MTSHNMRNTMEYRAWGRMKQACLNVNSNLYPSHGQRGITVCQQWLDFLEFFRDMGPMPANCNGISRLDNTKEFNRYNCIWSYNKRGCKRKPTTVPKPKKNPRWSKLKNAVTVCLTIEKDLLDFIKSQALQRSIELGHIVESNEMIRDALAAQFPMKKQLDLFKGAR